jgi:hypothetical protein
VQIRSLQIAVGALFLFAAIVLAQEGHGVRGFEDIPTLRARADSGDSDAQDILGRSYLYGQGVPQDERLAFDWIKKAADQDYSPAKVDLGHLYTQGRGVAADKAEGMKWYLSAAHQIKYVNNNQVDPRPILLITIMGRTVDWQAGQPVPGTGLALFTETDHKLVAVAAADDQGSFSLSTVKPGMYRLVAVYYPLCSANVPVNVIKARVKKKELTLHMRPSGLDACSWGDFR